MGTAGSCGNRICSAGSRDGKDRAETACVTQELLIGEKRICAMLKPGIARPRRRRPMGQVSASLAGSTRDAAGWPAGSLVVASALGVVWEGGRSSTRLRRPHNCGPARPWPPPGAGRCRKWTPMPPHSCRVRASHAPSSAPSARFAAPSHRLSRQWVCRSTRHRVHEVVLRHSASTAGCQARAARSK
eukprot:scaffold96490_cov31-Tisochrysis_lutea.AAC.2